MTSRQKQQFEHRAGRQIAGPVFLQTNTPVRPCKSENGVTFLSKKSLKIRSHHNRHPTRLCDKLRIVFTIKAPAVFRIHLSWEQGRFLCDFV